MKVAVLLSGGVDSSVALRLAQSAGPCDITAFYLKIWLEDELAFLGNCPWEEDLGFARAVCAQAGVPLHVLSLQQEYHDRVVSHAIRELKQGRTPSPDILCNQHIKFGLFFDKIDPAFDKIVSGHYAQIEQHAGLCHLKRSPDPVKDQSYFLSALDQRQLSRLWFPIGHLHKPEVRQLAARFQLPNCSRKDSQGICFLGKIKYNEFVKAHLGEREGEILEIETGRKLGTHPGVWFHTIGQRKGLRLGGGPWYVVRKDMDANRLYVTHSASLEQHALDRFEVAQVHWISGQPPVQGPLHAKLRHGPVLVPCTIEPSTPGRWTVQLAAHDYGIAPGQSAVFYRGEYCLGSGVIDS